MRGRDGALVCDNGKVVDDPEANAMLARPYREPWVHPRPDDV